MQDTQRAWVEINLDAIANNVSEIKKCLNPGVMLMGVVKADAYGHGVEETARTVLKSGADRLAVAFIDEGIQLRSCGFDVPILILGNSAKESIPLLLKYDITPTVFTVDFAENLSREAASAGKVAKIHIKLDTGMFRIGFMSSCDEEINKTVEDILKISQLENIEIEGIFTHFSTADEEDSGYTDIQAKRFLTVVERLEARGLKIPIKHLANSAAQMRFPQLQLDMVRAGIILYGLYPSDCTGYEGIHLMPAMKFCARVVNIKDVKCGSGISYGKTFVANKDMKIATIPVGYADGYSRVLSDKAEVSFDGKRLRQIGRICMDQCMIDVTNVNNINVGDTVTLFGDDIISVDDIAKKMGTINYEIVCIVGKRIPRIYIKDGIVTSGHNYLV